jgi:hypothetical protein
MAKPNSTEVPLVRGAENTSRVWVRYANASLGGWLFVSPFLWAHSAAARTNAWIVGLLIFVVAIVATTLRPMRAANTLLAIWLILTTLAFRHRISFTLWHDGLIAVLVLAFSLIPEKGEALRGSPEKFRGSPQK